MAQQIILDYPVYPRVRPFESSLAGQKLTARFKADAARYTERLEGFGRLEHLAKSIPQQGQDTDALPYWTNGWMPPLDAASICGLLLEYRPKRYVEIGSGTSTKFARATIDHFGLETRIVSIDPHPRSEINALCDEIVRTPCEDIAESFFAEFSSDDMLFVDNSHRAFQNSDVTVFFTESLPILPAGMVYGLHDISLPFDYPTLFLDRYYNEQYMLAAYIFGGGGGDEILLPCCWVGTDAAMASYVARLAARLGLPPSAMSGGCYWARRAAG